MRELTDRVAVVTGAGSGIGRALAEAFAAEGARVVIADVDETGLGATAELVRALGAEVLAVPTDVRDADAVDRLAARALAAFGGVHVLCNNAGVSRMGNSWEMSVEDWRWVLDVNLWGVVHGLRSFVPHLVAQPEAHVVNTSSMGGLMPAPFIAPYTASKHAVVGLSRSLRLELAGTAPHVGVTLLCPGAVATAMDPNTPRPGGGPEDLPPGAAALAEHVRADKDQGATPGAVAAATLDAVRENRFYVLPNAGDFLDVLRADFEAVLAAPTD
ncbi:SDR family NAD(P)-dependent oxidoreductase [Saccharothrix syringae]|nr:SDR family NAD(P)-dependent oxidoreductase [Saccharothrix syringae]ARS01471.1 NcmD [Saccharothrix syringae]